MSQVSNKLKKSIAKTKKAGLVFFLILSFVGVSFAVYNLRFIGQVYPNIFIADFPAGGKEPANLALALSKYFPIPEKIVLDNQNQHFEISTKDIEAFYDYDKSANSAYSLTRTGNVAFDSLQKIKLLFYKKNFGLRIKLDEDKLANTLSLISAQVSADPIEPSVSINGSIVEIYRGLPGSELDLAAARVEIGQVLAFAQSNPVYLKVNKINPELSDSEAVILKKRAETLIDKTLILTNEKQNFLYKGEELVNLIDYKNEYKNEEISKIASSVASKINKQPEEPVFVLSTSNGQSNIKVTEFTPSVNGITVDSNLLVNSIIGNLRILENTDKKDVSIEIPITVTPPKVTTADVNNLGINKLIGHGSSRFAHSIPNRIFNVALASSKFKGILVAPGETFSFNDTIGDVSAATGYKQAYVIKEGRTVLGDGGGVCQVSTTLFRAALAAGLPIVERAAHAYRVYYYEQDSPPGIDATVYSPTPDLKFKNDTPGYILIQPAVDTKNLTLVFDIYGTDDGRVATISKPIVSGATPPPPDLYQDDPTLKTGVIKQVDYAAWGAKVTFNYTVTRNGEAIFEKKFISNYRPWQAVYLRGTGQ